MSVRRNDGEKRKRKERRWDDCGRNETKMKCVYKIENSMKKRKRGGGEECGWRGSEGSGWSGKMKRRRGRGGRGGGRRRRRRRSGRMISKQKSDVLKELGTSIKKESLKI